MINISVDINAQEVYDDILYIILENCHEKMIQMLINIDIDVNAQEEEYNNVL